MTKRYLLVFVLGSFLGFWGVVALAHDNWAQLCPGNAITLFR